MSSGADGFEWNNSPCSSAAGGKPKVSSFSGTKHYHLPNSQQQQQQHKSRYHGLTFQQLADELFALITTNYKDAASNGAAIQNIQSVLKQLKQIYSTEESQNKKQNALHILHNASDILGHLFFLKNGTVPGISLAHCQYVDRTLKALKQTTSLSHDQYVGPVKALENRKLQVALCFVESITELLAHDVDTFGLSVDAYEKCGKMRREIANALMNVVYQQREAKLRLCSNLAFLRRVSDIMANVPTLDQYYAGLVQNVSYNCDKKCLLPFAHHLAITVPPMVRCVTFIAGDGTSRNALASWEHSQKQRLYKLFSALWNLAENPIENKRVMCLDFPDFVPILLRVMVGDPREVPLIQAAIGIFKHLSTFIIQYPDLFSKTLSAGAIRALLHQIYSSSPDLIIDALVALSILCRHPYATHELLCQKSCLENIHCLTKNTNEGIVRAARTLIDTINSVYYQAVALQNGMFNSVVGWNCASTSVEANHKFGYQIPVGTDTAVHYNTLPKVAQQNFFKPHKGQNDNETPKGVLRQQNFHHNSEGIGQNAMAQQKGQIADESREHLVLSCNTTAATDAEGTAPEECVFVTEPLIEAGQNIATSVQCTRAASPQSSAYSRSVDGVANGDEWPSVRSTSFNSERTSGTNSPASASDLPDSPSQCVAHKPFQLEAMAMLIKKALEEEEREGDKTDDGKADNETMGENVPGQKRQKRISDSNALLEGDDNQSDNATSGDTLAEESATNADSGSINDAFLDEVIRKYMPKPNGAPIQCLAPAGTAQLALNTTPTSSNSPSKSPVIDNDRAAETKDNKTANDRLLEESIASMMPHPSNKKGDGKEFVRANGQRQQQFVHSACQQKHNDLVGICTTEQFVPQQITEADNELPADVDAEFDAQWMVVECGETANCAKMDEAHTEEKRRFALKKTNSQSSIPRPAAASVVAHSARSPRKAAADLEMDDDTSANSNSLLKRPTPMRSSIKSSKAPPLAPKPNIAKLIAKPGRPTS